MKKAKKIHLNKRMMISVICIILLLVSLLIIFGGGDYGSNITGIEGLDSNEILEEENESTLINSNWGEIDWN